MINIKYILFYILLLLPGCTLLSPEIIEALSRDAASFCATTDIRGGVGSLMSPAGGYGQGTLSFCRSNFPNSIVTLLPDGTISIQHGSKDVE